MSVDSCVNNGVEAKYSRLIADYKSLREKHNIIRNALVAEREKSSQLEVQLNEARVQSRKLLQEVDSLSFRNDLLTKQTNTLRDELGRERQRKGRRTGQDDAVTSRGEVEVVREELAKKIEECMQLHAKLANTTTDQQTETDAYRSAISDLENQLRQLQERAAMEAANVRNALAREMEERTALETRIEHLAARPHTTDKNSVIGHLTDRIQSLEEALDGQHLAAELAGRRLRMEIAHREQCERIIVSNGWQLSDNADDRNTSTTTTTDVVNGKDGDTVDGCLRTVYEQRLRAVRQQLRVAIAWAAICWDEGRLRAGQTSGNDDGLRRMLEDMAGECLTSQPTV